MQKLIFNIKKYGQTVLKAFFSLFLGSMTFLGIQAFLSGAGLREDSWFGGIGALLVLYVMVATYNPKQVLSIFRKNVDRFDNRNELSNDNIQKL